MHPDRAGWSALVFGLLALACLVGSGKAVAGPWSAVNVSVRALAIDPASDRGAISGPLSAFSLHSGDKHFGGLSAATWYQGWLYLLSDRGTAWRARPVLAADGRLQSLIDWQWAWVMHAGERGEADLEALTVDRQGRLLASVEGTGRVYELVVGDRWLELRRLDLPALFSSIDVNAGIEALAATPDGGLVAIREGAAAGLGGHPSVLVSASGEITDRLYRAAIGHDPTDAVWLGDGLLVLERRFGLLSGWQAQLAHVTIADDGELSRTPVLQLAHSGLPLDNFEGLALREYGGRYHALLVSDDNFLPIQSTLVYELPLPALR